MRSFVLALLLVVSATVTMPNASASACSVPETFDDAQGCAERAVHAGVELGDAAIGIVVTTANGVVDRACDFMGETC